MSDMEQSYKEKYEDILARLERAKNDNDVCDERFCCVINDIIPELAESEDEKIRKWIVDDITFNMNNEPLNNSEYRKKAEKAIAWLEKQGEQNPADKVEPKFKVGDKIYLKPEYRMPDDDTPIANTVKEIRRIDDKHYRFDGSYIFIEDQDKYELVEPKPEENKGNLGGISPNWSEEDEDYLFLLNSICKDAEEKYRNSPDVLVRKEIANARNWLKSLRPQNRWKPSDEQMELLSEVQSALLGKDCHNRFTGFMWELKKLKEE